MSSRGLASGSARADAGASGPQSTSAGTRAQLGGVGESVADRRELLRVDAGVRSGVSTPGTAPAGAPTTMGTGHDATAPAARHGRHTWRKRWPTFRGRSSQAAGSVALTAFVRPLPPTAPGCGLHPPSRVVTDPTMCPGALSPVHRVVAS